MFESKKVIDELYNHCCNMLDDIKSSTDLFTGSPQYTNYSECIFFGCFCYYIAGCKSAGYARKVITKYYQERGSKLGLPLSTVQIYIQKGYTITRESAEKQMHQGIISPDAIANIHAKVILNELAWETSESNINLLGGVTLLLFYAYLTGNAQMQLKGQLNMLKS